MLNRLNNTNGKGSNAVVNKQIKDLQDAVAQLRTDVDQQEIDIASTRTEIYPKVGHLPVIEKIGCSLSEDLSRRDFTINAMAKNTLSGEIIDIFSGLNDIKDKKISVTVFLINGVKLQGVITWFDATSLLLRRDGHTQLVYSHAVSTIMPATPVDVVEG